MPVINLVNIPKHNLVFSLQVLWYIPGAHGAHVALQERDTSMSTNIQTRCINHMSYYGASIKFEMERILLPGRNISSYLRHREMDHSAAQYS